MKIAVIVSDAAGAVHAGLDVTRSTRVFDLPPDMARYIETNSQQYMSVSFAIVDEPVAQGSKG